MSCISGFFSLGEAAEMTDCISGFFSLGEAASVVVLARLQMTQVHLDDP